MALELSGWISHSQLDSGFLQFNSTAAELEKRSLSLSPDAVSQFNCSLPYLVVWEMIRVTPPLTPDRWRVDRDMWGAQSRRPHDPHLFLSCFASFGLPTTVWCHNLLPLPSRFPPPAPYQPTRPTTEARPHDEHHRSCGEQLNQCTCKRPGALPVRILQTTLQSFGSPCPSRSIS